MKNVTLAVLGGVLAVVALLCGAYSAYWFILADRVERSVAAWTAAQNAQGRQIAYTGLQITGFPGPVRVRFVEPRAADPSNLVTVNHLQIGAWSWASTWVDAEVLPWAPGELRLWLDGEHLIAALVNGEVRSVRAQADATDVTILVDEAGNLRELVAVIERGTVRVAETKERLRFNRFKVRQTLYPPALAKAAPSFDFNLSMEDAELPAMLWGPLGTTIQGLAFRSTLIGRVPPILSQQALGDWRDENGQLKIERLDVAWGPVDLRAQGRLNLDGGLQPQAQFNGELRGWDGIIDSLRAGGRMSQREAAFARTALRALAKPGEGGMPPSLNLPIYVRDRSLFIGPVKMTEFPPIVWP